RVKLFPPTHRTHASRRSSRGSLLRRRNLDAAASRRGMSIFRGCSSRRAVRIMTSDTSILQPWERGGYSMKALRTLVVEDDAMIGGLLAETLEGLGHAVCAVETNVAKAVATASHWRPDLMIVDVGLGEASGIAAVKEILRSGFVPHVFVTGEALSGVSLGPDTVLMRKPFRVSDLDQAIQRALATAATCDPPAESVTTAKFNADGITRVGTVTLPCEERERSTPYGFSSRRDGLAP